MTAARPRVTTMGQHGERKHGNLAGRSFGRIVVTRDPSATGKYRVDFRCSCGTEGSANRYGVVSGNTGSCGCALTESRGFNGRRNAADLTGRKFGRLTALRRVTAPGEVPRTPLWLFACECGREKIIGGNYVASGQIASCGCAVGSVVRPVHHRKRANAYRRKRRLTDPKAALISRFGNAVRKSLTRRGSKKRAQWEIIFGYSVDALVEHLSSTMPPGYTWEDYRSGLLHIDHRRPLASFRFSSERDAEFIAAWSLSNLQMLTADENMRKHAKWDGA